MFLTLVGITSQVNADDMQRLYNPNSGEHFYTANIDEKTSLSNIGWNYEGIGWVAPNDGKPVYRLYNKNSGDHHYTMSVSEKNMLVSKGWKDEGKGWYSDSKETVPLYRAYNPNATSGSHNYTTNRSEQQNLIRAGWKDEGIAWYATKSGSSVSSMKLSDKGLASLNYSGQQTINVNNGIPTFSEQDMALKNGSWEKYGDLDQLNRATSAEAMLNKDLMPTGSRGDISSVTPTGWKNKKIKSGYLYNRSHLIGWALAGENANWKNLITGTQQLNNPEMLRHEMDVKYYLEKSSDNYVRYSVTPIFRGNELVARGVHMQAQSVGNNDIQFNVYIFNIQDGVTINYSDGSSVISSKEQVQKTNSNNNSSANNTTNKPATSQTPPATNNTVAAAGTYVDANGNGLIKGSKSGIYHIPGSKYYNKTTNVVRWFKTVSEAQAAGYRAPK